MKDLDKNEVYDLRGATSEQLGEVINWLRKRQPSWYNTEVCDLAKNTYVRFDGGGWVRGHSEETTVHISTLFEDKFVLPEKWCVRGSTELSKYFRDNSIGYYGSDNNKIFYKNPKGLWDWDYDYNIGGKQEITFEQFKKYVLKEENEMEKLKGLTITRQALSEIYPKVCYTWQKKIEGLLNEGLFKEEFEVMPRLVNDAFKAADNDFQKEWLKKYFPQREKMKLTHCLQNGTDIWAEGKYLIDPSCTYERIQSYKDGLAVILKTGVNGKILYLGYWNNGKY